MGAARRTKAGTRAPQDRPPRDGPPRTGPRRDGPPRGRAEPVLPFEASVGYQVRLTHRLVQRALQSRIEPHGVTLGMWYYLRALWNRDGLTQSELSGLIGTMEPTTLSAVVAMERAGIVRRERNRNDRRKINVFLTEKGQALRRDLLPEGIAVVEAAIASFDDDEVALILSLLGRIQRNLAREYGEADARGRRPIGSD